MIEIDVKSTQSTLPTEEWNQFITFFGNGVEGDVQVEDLLYYLEHPELMPENMATDDLLMVYIAFAGELPDPSIMDQYADDTSVQTALEEFVLDWQDTDSVQAAIEQAQDFYLSREFLPTPSIRLPIRFRVGLIPMAR